MQIFFCLIVGGAVGTLARFFLTGAAQNISGSQFPFGTMAVNLTGCFLAGFAAILLDEKFHLGLPARVLFVTGFCGAFTTFSAWIIESDFLLRQDIFKGLLNILVSVAAGFLLFRLGAFLAGKIS